MIFKVFLFGFILILISGFSNSRAVGTCVDDLYACPPVSCCFGCGCPSSCCTAVLGFVTWPNTWIDYYYPDCTAAAIQGVLLDNLGELAPQVSSAGWVWVSGPLPVLPHSECIFYTVGQGSNWAGNCEGACSLPYNGSGTEPPTNASPTCTIYGSNSVIAGNDVLLTSTATDSDGTIKTYKWEAAAGSFSTTNKSSTTWTAPSIGGATQTVKLTVTDNDNATGTCTKNINVLCSTYDLKITAKEVAASTTWQCTHLDSKDPLGSVRIRVYDHATHTLISSRLTNASGVTTFSDLNRWSQRNLDITASKTTTGANPSSYSLMCAQSEPTLSFHLLYNPAPGSCETKEETIGVGKQPKEAWSVVLDGDVYGPSIETAVPSGVASGGFKNYLINAPTSIGGIALSDDEITTSRLYDTSTSFGAWAKNLSIPIYGGDVALSRFSFTPPTHGDVEDLGTLPAPGTTYVLPNSSSVFKTTVAKFNTWLAGSDPKYTIQGTAKPIKVLYLTGIGTLSFVNGLKSTNSNRLIIITGSAVAIQTTTGFDAPYTATYTSTARPNIEASIISQGNITFKSVSSGVDIPVMATGPLVSKAAVTFQRDLGQDLLVGNGVYPAQSIKYYPKSLYGVTNLEYANKDTPNYTGLRSFDVQFVFDDWNTYPTN